MQDFVHEGRSEGDDHCVTPRLAKGPHYDHPDCPSKISMFDFDFLKIVCHLLQSMSLISGKTFPWSCFSLTAGSNVRFSRISFLSWKHTVIPNLQDTYHIHSNYNLFGDPGMLLWKIRSKGKPEETPDSKDYEPE